MPADRKPYGPILEEYYNKILTRWLSQLPCWKTDLFRNRGKELKASAFQSFIMYPFQAGEIKGEPTDMDVPLQWEFKDYAQKEIPLYNAGRELVVDEKYAENRNPNAFLKGVLDVKKTIRASREQTKHKEIPPPWIKTVTDTDPWDGDLADSLWLLIMPYMNLLERLCLRAATDEKADFAQEFQDIRDKITDSVYFCDLFLFTGWDLPALPEEQNYYVSRAAEHLKTLLKACAEQAEKLVQIIIREFQQGKLKEAFEKEFGSQVLTDVLNKAFVCQRAQLQANYQNAHSALFDEPACQIRSVPLWYLYQQNFILAKGDFDTKAFAVHREQEKAFCALMANKLADPQPCVPEKDRRGSQPENDSSVFNQYFEQMCKAAILLYLGIYLHFREGNTQLFAMNDAIDISTDGDYLLPADLPLSLEKLRAFVKEHSPCLLCGGSGSGKSTYLKKISELQKKKSGSFSLVVDIPLRFLVSNSTEQADDMEPTLESSLIWQRVRKTVLQRDPAEGQETLAKVEKNLTDCKIGVAPVLLLLDGYNEILTLQNEAALERLRSDIKWLSSKSNVRIIMTYRTEWEMPETELRSSMHWLFSPGREKKDVVYITYDEEEMARLGKGTWVLTRKPPRRLLRLLENRPMYLMAAKDLDDSSEMTQYTLLNRIYEQRCRAGLDSPLVRDGRKTHWMALYSLLLPELAYRMVAEGKQVLMRHELHEELRKTLAGHNETIRDGEDIGSLYWWNDPQTRDAIDRYPFKGCCGEEDIDWIERALLGSDKILEKDGDGAIAFFHEDIRNYLAAKHIAQRFRLYVNCAGQNGCYKLPIRWERVPKEMYSLVYEALAAEFDVALQEREEAEAAKILEKLVFPAVRERMMPEFMLPGDWMRLKFASQIQEYEKRERQKVMLAFAASAKPLADDYLNASAVSLDENAKEILGWTLCRLSQYERQDGKHPVPETATRYAQEAVDLVSSIPAVDGEPSQWKIAQHYLAKTQLYQAQYLWTQCSEECWPEADSLFRQASSMLKVCAAGDDKNAGFNLSNNLLGLWKYSPAPYLRKKQAFQEEIGDIDYAGAFDYFLRSVAFSPSKSSNRAYAAAKCIAILLEQQVFLSAGLAFASLEEFLRRFMQNPGIVMKADTAGHGVLSLRAPELEGNIRAAGFLLKETEQFVTEEHSYYKGLYLLYCACRRSVPDISRQEMKKEFAGDKKNPLKDKLCLAFVEAGKLLHAGKVNEAVSAWGKATDSFRALAEEERQAIPPKDTGSLDAGHRIHNQQAYKNLLEMLSLTLTQRK